MNRGVNITKIIPAAELDPAADQPELSSLFDTIVDDLMTLRQPEDGDFTITVRIFPRARKDEK